jgi:hypothetical protein
VSLSIFFSAVKNIVYISLFVYIVVGVCCKFAIYLNPLSVES